jgi:hypothetical protein
MSGFNKLVYGYFALPVFDSAFLQYLAGVAYLRWLCWASLLADFVDDVLYMTV